MTVAERIDWDGWRAGYDAMTVDDHRDFYDGVWEQHPDQARFDMVTFDKLLDRVEERPVTVVELGGWDGAFAEAMLDRDTRIVRWENHEICDGALAASVCRDARYVPVKQRVWYWQTNHAATVFVASHVLEHMTFRDVQRTLDATCASFLFLQVPVGEGPTDWNGYHGTHILEVGWSDLNEELGRRGYRLIDDISRPMVRCYQR